MYKPVSAIPEFSASSRPAGADGGLSSGLNSIVEIGHDAVGSLTKEMQHQLSIDSGTRSLVRQNQQQALVMAGFACTQEYEQRSKTASRNQTLQAAGFIETSGVPQPLLSGNYNQMYSNRNAVPGRTEPSDLIGQYDADNWACVDGSKSLPRRQQGILIPKSGARYPKGYRKPQNGGGAPQSNTEAAKTFLESSQSRQLVRHESWNGRTSKSIPIYENVVDGAIVTDDVDSAEGNVTLQSRHSKYGSTPDLQRNLIHSSSHSEQVIEQTADGSNKQLNNRKHSSSPSLSKFGSQPDLQNQNLTVEADNTIQKKPTLTKSASCDSDIYASMPNLQRASSAPVQSTQNIAPQGILADAIKNDQEIRKIMRTISATQSSSSSVASSPDSKRSSQASQASTFTTDSVDTSKSSGSTRSTGSLRSKYGVASGFVTLPRKKRISDFAEGRNSQQSRSHGPIGREFIQRSQSDPPLPMSHGPPQPLLQQQNSAPAQFAGVFIDDDDDTAPMNSMPGTSPPARRPSHLQHFTTEGETRKRSDPTEEGSVGSKDSGKKIYRCNQCDIATAVLWVQQRYQPFLFQRVCTPKCGKFTISGKFCPIENVCDFENFTIFYLNPPCFLDVNVGIFGTECIVVEITVLTCD